MCFLLVGTTRLAATEAIFRSKSVEIEYERLYSTPLHLVDFFASNELLRLARLSKIDCKSVVKELSHHEMIAAKVVDITDYC